MTAGNFKGIAQWVPGRSGRLVQEEKSLLVDVVVWVAVVALWSLLWRVAGVAGAGPQGFHAGGLRKPPRKGMFTPAAAD